MRSVMTTPDEDNEPFWTLIDAVLSAARDADFNGDYNDDPENEYSLTEVELSSMEVQALLSATVDEDNAPLRNLVDAINRAVNEGGGGDWTGVNLSGIREFILPVVSRDGVQLLHASDALKNDREVVMAAVNQNGLAIEYASDTLKGDREVVLAAMKHDCQGFVKRWYSAAARIGCAEE